MCRHSYSLSHEKSEKMFWIVTWPISHRFRDKRRFPSKIAKFSHPRVYIAPAGIGYRPRAPQSFNPALLVVPQCQSDWSTTPCSTCTQWKNLVHPGEGQKDVRDTLDLHSGIRPASNRWNIVRCKWSHSGFSN